MALMSTLINKLSPYLSTLDKNRGFGGIHDENYPLLFAFLSLPPSLMIASSAYISFVNFNPQYPSHAQYSRIITGRHYV